MTKHSGGDETFLGVARPISTTQKSRCAISDQNPGWLGYIGDEKLPGYMGDYNGSSIQFYIDDEKFLSDPKLSSI